MWCARPDVAQMCPRAHPVMPPDVPQMCLRLYPTCPQMCHMCPSCATCLPAVPQTSPHSFLLLCLPTRQLCLQLCPDVAEMCHNHSSCTSCPSLQQGWGRSHPIPLRNPHQSCWCCKSEGGTTPELQHSAPHLPLVTLTEASLPLGNGHLTSSCCLLFFIQK